MKLSEIQKLLECEMLTRPDMDDPEIKACMGSDMMSDVLAFATPDALLITGLVNSQSVRTADVADAVAILYIRGKRPDAATIELAEDLSIPILATGQCMFDVCGILFREDLEGAC